MNKIFSSIKWGSVGLGAFWVVTVLGYFSLAAIVSLFLSPYVNNQLAHLTTGEFCRTGGNVANLSIIGPLYTSRYDDNDTTSSDIVRQINLANEATYIRAILLEIDSPGGDPTAGEEIAAAVASSEKPVYALARGYATSAAYWAGISSKSFYAYPSSLVGSIGVTASFVDNSEKNKREGLTYNQLSTGKFKDMYDPAKPLTNDERTQIERQLNKLNEIFIDQIAERRQLPREQVSALADGSAMLAGDAKAAKLIDEIGTATDVKNRISTDLGARAVLCW